ncbi:MAG: 8-oxoguanine deaminase [Anaerolineae bacterium UTCFX1]|jgi:cytosine/adenosine deaminase-related metal-dependent hydrolase|nr:MAG: 8-oxoguanine deaminase [Anaerolineae bacterium UTCFX1]
MSSLLVKNAHLIVMDDRNTEFSDGGLFIENGFISQVGATRDLPSTADEVLNLKGRVVLPGLVNTHHHFYQTLTRAVPAAQDANLFNWLTTLYPIWAKIQPDDIFTSTQTALAELALSGCTAAADHLYLYPNGSKLDDEIAAAAEIGLRLHASRGSMSLGEADGGLPPDSVVDDEESILKDSQRLIQKYHDAKPGSMVQIVLAPCSPFSVTSDLMKQSAKLAREYGVHLHTHLAETEDEEQFCLEKFGHRPVEYMQEVDWVGDDVWFAHAVWVNDEEIKIFAQHNCGVAHCPSSNMRLASGIAPIKKYRRAGVNVGLGVDGSASNDGSHLLAEARNAMLLARVQEGITGFSLSDDPNRKLMTARETLWMGTRGGAAILGREDIGSLEAGKCADFFAVDLNKLGFAGMHDPVAAIVFGQPVNVEYTVVGGKFVVKEGRLATVDERKLIERHNSAAKRLLTN